MVHKLNVVRGQSGGGGTSKVSINLTSNSPQFQEILEGWGGVRWEEVLDFQDAKAWLVFFWLATLCTHIIVLGWI